MKKKWILLTGYNERRVHSTIHFHSMMEHSYVIFFYFLVKTIPKSDAGNFFFYLDGISGIILFKK
jgi:hypothetical protein